jgi:ubiquitin carboxyl-terminal hydrolase 9/24
LQLLFAGLLKSEKQYVNPKRFCYAFKDWDWNLDKNLKNL